MQKLQHIAKQSIYWLKVISLGLILGLGIQFAQAWVNPTVAPPGGNVSGPITLGGISQYKTGFLGINTVSTPISSLEVGGTALIGGNALVSGNVGIGTSNPSEKLDVNGNVRASAFFYASDSNLKENVKPIVNPLHKVLALNGYTFEWKQNGQKDIGVIAQEVEVQFPELVHIDEKTGMKSVEYGNLVAPLIEAVKELSTKVESQNEQIESLQEYVKILEAKK